MELVKRNIKNIRRVSFFKKSDNLNILEEFIESGFDCVEVKNFTQKSAKICASSLANSIKHYRFSGIAAISRKNHAYLIRKDTTAENTDNGVDNIQMAYLILVDVMKDSTSNFDDFASAVESAIGYLGSELDD